MGRTEKNGDKGKKGAKGKEKGKEKEKETKRGPQASTLSRVLDKVLALICLVIVLARVDFLTAFGVGTGVNKTHLTPISVISYYVSNTDAIRTIDPRLDIASKKIMVSLAVPGEILSDLLGASPKAKASGKSKKSKSSGEDYAARAARWTQKTAKHRGLARVMPGNHLLPCGAAVALLGASLALLFPDVGFTFFLGGTMMMYVGATMATPKVEVTYGVTHVAMPLAVYAILLQQRLAAVGQEKAKAKAD